MGSWAVMGARDVPKIVKQRGHKYVCFCNVYCVVHGGIQKGQITEVELSAQQKQMNTDEYFLIP